MTYYEQIEEDIIYRVYLDKFQRGLPDYTIFKVIEWGMCCECSGCTAHIGDIEKIEAKNVREAIEIYKKQKNQEEQE